MEHLLLSSPDKLRLLPQLYHHLLYTKRRKLSRKGQIVKLYLMKKQSLFFQKETPDVESVTVPHNSDSSENRTTTLDEPVAHCIFSSRSSCDVVHLHPRKDELYSVATNAY